MSLCIKRNSKNNAPNTIIDTSTMSINLDNQGMATIQIAILDRSVNPITSACCTCSFEDSTFKGFILSDTPQRLEGTDYIEHNLVIRGMIYEGNSDTYSPSEQIGE